MPIMLAYLYNRSCIFIYLLYESATIAKQDLEGFTYINYIKHGDFTKPLLKKYTAIAGQKPRLLRQKKINRLLQQFLSILKPDLLKKEETKKSQTNEKIKNP